jgi:hypothetical protein
LPLVNPSPLAGKSKTFLNAAGLDKRDIIELSIKGFEGFVGVNLLLLSS